MSSNSDKKLVVIVGPTAIGKTKCCILLAQMAGAEIISADSRQFFKELKIGTAVPSQEELMMVKHHLVGHLSVNDYYNVSLFENHALSIVQKLHIENNFAFVTGGSGLYIDALCNGIDDLPDPVPDIRNQLNQTLKNEGLDALRLQLRQIDPAYYETVDLANPKRVMRGIEVFLTTGKKFSELRVNRRTERPFEIIKIGLNRPRVELFENINRRVDMMFEQGLAAEVESLLPFRHLNALNTVGYKEIFECMEQGLPPETAAEKIKTNTRRYAKRQLTWFKRDDTIRWFHPDEVEAMAEYCKIKNA